jgi:hypothetical protein
MGDNGESGGLPAAGWYPDVANSARERLWTGERWIEWIRPVRVARVEADPAGWRPDPDRPGAERLWSGEMWTEETRLVGPSGAGGRVWPAVSGGAAAGPGPIAGLPAPGAPGSPPTLFPPAVLYRDDHPPQRLGALGVLVQIALGLVIAAAIVYLVADQIYIGVLTDFLHGNLPTVSHTESVTDTVHAANGALFILEMITAFAYLFWFYRAYRNLIRTGIRDVRFGPGWAVGGWFIPFFNLVRPKQVANDIWKGSVSAGTVGVARWREVGLSATINWWWGVWIFAAVMIAIGNRAVTRASVEHVTFSTRLNTERTDIWLMQIGLVALIVAAFLAILVVRRITKLQDANFRAVPAWDPGASAAADPWAAGGASAVVAPATTAPDMSPTTPASGTKTCPECAEQVNAAARVCRYCGHRFHDPV